MLALHQVGDIISAESSVVGTGASGNSYRVDALLGEGGTSLTYAATVQGSGEQVAIKVLSLKNFSDWKVAELFEREAQVLKHLDHPHIPNYCDYFQITSEDDHRFYLVQELVAGKSLAALVHREAQDTTWQANEKQARWIAEAVLKILTYLHGLMPPVIHRDIKPDNLILQPGGTVYLVDFNAMQAVYRNTKSFRSTFVGTLGYMPPEQFSGQVSFCSDLYSLGATLVFLLSGQSPAELPEEDMAIQFREVIGGRISTDFADWLEQMLEPMAEDRFQTAEMALAALRGEPLPDSPGPQPQTFGAYVDPHMDELGVWLHDAEFDSSRFEPSSP